MNKILNQAKSLAMLHNFVFSWPPDRKQKKNDSPVNFLIRIQSPEI